MVDRRLASNGRIHLREQCRWHLNEGRPALITGRSKPCKIAHYPAAQSNDRGLALTSVRQQCVENRIQRLPVLVLLAIRQHDRNDLHACAAQHCAEPFKIKRGDRDVSDHGNLALRQMWQEQVGTREQGFSNMDRVSSLAQAYDYGSHRV